MKGVAVVDWHTPTGAVTITRRIPNRPVTAEHQAMLHAWLADVAAELRMPIGDAAAAVMGELMIREHQQAVYERVAEARGVLPL